MPQPRTYNDSQVSELARDVFMKSLGKASDMLDGKETFSTERLEAYANIASAASNGFQPEEENHDEGFD